MSPVVRDLSGGGEVVRDLSTVGEIRRRPSLGQEAVKFGRAGLGGLSQLGRGLGQLGQFIVSPQEAAPALQNILGGAAQAIEAPIGFTAESLNRLIEAGGGDPTQFFRDLPALRRVTPGRVVAEVATAVPGKVLAGGAALAAGTVSKAGVNRLIPGFSHRYELLVDQVFEGIARRMPRMVRAGGGAPLELREAKSLAKAEIAQATEEAIELTTPLKKQLSAAEQVRAHQILRGSVTKLGTKMDLFTLPLRNAINQIQHELVRMGRLTPRTVQEFEARFGPYLKRVYEAKILQETPSVVRVGDPIKRGLRQRQVFKRGEWATIKLGTDLLHNPAKRVQDSQVSQLIRQGYRLRQIDFETGMARYFRDIPERTRMGTLKEIQKAPFVAAKTIQKGRRELAVAKFFNFVARNPEWAMESAQPGFRKLQGSGNSLGALVNKFVREDVAAEIDDFSRFMQDSEKIYSRLLSMWKVGKVTNPGTMARNVLSSAMLADFGGLSWFRPSGAHTYVRALRGMLNKPSDVQRLVAEARRGGLYRAAWNEGEINALLEGYFGSESTSPILRFLDAVQRYSRKIGDTTGVHGFRLYGAIDSWFKTALYIHAREKMGRTALDALRFAKKWGIDYEDISPIVRMLRKQPLFGAPFMTFASKAIPLALEASVKHPIRFWKYPFFIFAGNEIAREALGSSPEEVSQVRQLAEMNPWRYVQLPFRDEADRELFLDMGYILPFGDMIEVMDWAQGRGRTSVSFLPPGGPALAFMEILFNRSMFTGKELFKPTDEFSRRLAKANDHLGKSLFPAFTPPVPFTGFRGGFATEAFRRATDPGRQLPGELPLSGTDISGEPVSLALTVLNKVFGLRVSAVDPDVIARIRASQFQQEFEELMKDAVSSQVKGFTPEQREAESARVMERFWEIAEDLKRDVLGE